MKKIKLLSIVLFFINTLVAQNNKYFTRNATITFVSAAPMEKISSKNSQVNCILNTQTNDLAFKVVVKSFKKISNTVELKIDAVMTPYVR
ncbi:MAG: hypothetical protein IPF58_15335 [Saprospirales bacterium]|nr:hypothetical protein [Saprospirales bacterium]